MPNHRPEVMTLPGIRSTTLGSSQPGSLCSKMVTIVVGELDLDIVDVLGHDAKAGEWGVKVAKD